MGVYDSGFDFTFNPDDRKKLAMGAAAIFALIIIGFLLFYTADAVSLKPVSMRFEKNPVKPGEPTKIIATVSNVSELDSVNVP